MKIINIIILFLILLILSYFGKEHFTNLPFLIYNLDIPKNIHLIHLNNTNINLNKFIEKLINIKITNDKTNMNSYIISTFEYYNLSNVEKYSILSVIPFKKHLLLISKLKDQNIDSLLSNTNEILCQNISCIQLIKFIINLLDYNINNYKFITNDEINQELIDKYNLIVQYDTLDNLNNRMSQYIFDIISNDNFLNKTLNLNIHKQKILIPFIQSENYDMKIYFPKILSKFSVKRIFEFDMLLVCNKDCNTDVMIEEQIKSLILNLNQLDKNNYYSKYFKLHYLTEYILKNYNNFIKNRENLSILEQYKNIDLEFDENIKGFYESDENKFIIDNTNINNIPLLKDQKITLKNQNRIEENGTYKVYDLKTNTILIKTNIDNNFTNKNDDIFDSRYRCYNNTSYNLKGLCESNFDELGEIKPFKTYWDRPCETNKECPFYQKNKNYKNYRGGCIDGYCELPIGITRLSYRQYDKNSKPYCHNCADKLTGKCCDKQLNPDYAFELDEFERQ